MLTVISRLANFISRVYNAVYCELSGVHALGININAQCIYCLIYYRHRKHGTHRVKSKN